MKNTVINIPQWIKEKTRDYEPGPRPATGPRPLSKQKFEAALWRGLTEQTLSQIAERTGVSHDTCRQWARQRRFIETSEEAKQEFAVFFVDQIVAVYEREAEDFHLRFETWMQSESTEPPPKNDGPLLKYAGGMPEDLKYIIAKEFSKLFRSIDTTTAISFKDLAIVNAFDDFEEIFLPRYGQGKEKKRQNLRIQAAAAFLDSLKPMMGNEDLPLPHRKHLQLLAEIIQGAADNVKES